MKKGFLLILLLAGIGISAQSAKKEIYAVLSDEGMTFTLYYDQNKPQTGALTPDEWGTSDYVLVRSNVEKVVFDKSMDNAYPTSTAYWFDGFNWLTTIEHIEYLHTDEVTSMTAMFWECHHLTSLDLHNFNMAKVTRTDLMFSGCNSLTTICCDENWSKGSITNSKDMFKGCKSLKGQNGTVFSADHITIEYAHPDEGTANPGYFTLPEIYGMFNEESRIFQICYDGGKTAQGGFSPEEWMSESYTDIREAVLDVIFDSSMDDARPTNTSNWFNGFSALKAFYNLSHFHTEKVTDMSYMFANCTSLASTLNLFDFDTENVTSMKGLFQNCLSLETIQLQHFDLSKVTDASEMFAGCASMKTIYCNDDWNVLDFNDVDMFMGCTGLRGINNDHTTIFDEAHTGKEYARPNGGSALPGYFTEINYVYGAFSKDGNTFTLYFDTKKKERGGTTSWTSDKYAVARAGVKKIVVDESMRYCPLYQTFSWFNGFSGTTSIEHLEYLNTYYTKDMAMMFKDCSSLEVLDLRGLLLDNLMYADRMFKGCSSLKTVYCSYDLNSAKTHKSLTGTDMFAGCTSLVGGKGTVYDASHTDKTYATPWGKTGYFTVVDEIYAFTSNETFCVCYDGKRLNTPVRVFYPDGRIESESVLPEEWMSDDYAERRQQVTKIRFYTDMNKSLTNTAHWFEGFSAVTEVAGMSLIKTDEVTDMSYMFAGCEKLDTIEGLDKLNTGKVKSMKGMFMNCKSVKELNVLHFDMSHVTDASSMFAGCKSLEVIECENEWSSFSFDGTDMFAGCTSLQGSATPPTAYDAEHTGKEYARIDGGTANPGYFSKQKEIYGVFSPDGETYTLYYDTKKAERGGLEPAYSEENKEQRMNVKTVVFDETMKKALPTSTAGWFFPFTRLTNIQHLDYLNTSNVTAMARMFSNCHKLKSVDIRTFDMRNVVYMWEMFYYCNAIENIYLPTKYRIENVTGIDGAFGMCTCLTELDLRAFDTKDVTSMERLFYRDKILKVIYSDDDWSLNKSIQNDNNMFYECLRLTGGQGTIYSYYNNDGIEYAHPDNGETNPGYFTLSPKEIYGIYSSTGDTLTLYYDKQKIARKGCNWTLGIYREANGKVRSVILDESVKEARPTDCGWWFSYFYQLRHIEHLDYLNTSEVTSMAYMFYNCYYLDRIDLRTFDFSKVQHVYYMFGYCSNLRFILCNEDLPKKGQVKLDYEMFTNCTVLNGENGTAYDNEHVSSEYARPDEGTASPGYFSKEIPNVFYSVFSEDGAEVTFYYDNLVSERKGEIVRYNSNGYLWDECVNNVQKAVFDESMKDARLTFTTGLFRNFYNLRTIEHLGYLNTSEVTDMQYMFKNCYSLASVDVRNFDISKVENMNGMFLWCLSLERIYCNTDWSESTTLTESGDMFYLCIKIKGGHGTTYDSNATYITYARPDGGADDKGYFTRLYTVTFLGKEGGVIAETDTEDGYPASAPEAPEVEGCLFSGWDTDFTVVTGDLTVRAQYVAVADLTDEMYVSVSGKNMTVRYDKQRLTLKNAYLPEDVPSSARRIVTKAVIDKSLKEADITSTSNLFANMDALEEVEGLENISTAGLTDVSFMFQNCKSLTKIDINGFDLSGVSAAYGMFQGCVALTTIVCNANYTALAGINSLGMFDGCSNLTGGKGTKYSNAHKDASYARPDEGVSAPGYFTSTDKPTGVKDVQEDNALCTKVLRNGILYIQRGGKTYNVTGQITE
ncbi:MAG: BspA family leucine-rich repeat surface protein [Paludibacteraceae bacterium]|nr:BspA family leucine-rich repeat surface protein [Paludibacteraceae bacterium]